MRTCKLSFWKYFKRNWMSEYNTKYISLHLIHIWQSGCCFCCLLVTCSHKIFGHYHYVHKVEYRYRVENPTCSIYTNGELLPVKLHMSYKLIFPFLVSPWPLKFFWTVLLVYLLNTESYRKILMGSYLPHTHDPWTVFSKLSKKVQYSHYYST